MQNSRMGIPQIVLLNIKNSFARVLGLVILMALLSAVLFTGAVLSQSLNNGLRNMKDRLGADIMIVPVENEGDFEAVLLKGEPSCFYFGKSLEQKVAGIEGVELSSSQFFLTSLDAECCDARVQLIGFDPSTDFSVQPWISKVYDGDLTKGAVIIGNEINVESGENIKLFGTEYKVAAKLDATGTGLDQAVYATMDTINSMYLDAIDKGQRFLEDADPENSISTILVRADENYDRKKLIRAIRKELGGVKIIESQNMITGTAANMKSIASFMLIFASLFLITSVVTLFLVFSLMANERKKEFAILRTLGATRKKLAGIILSESVVISAAGGVIGAVIAMLIIFPFNVYIGDRLGMPYLLPSFWKILWILFIDLLVSTLIGPLSAALSAVKISKAETYLTMREGE
ncbi:ABC transporter permease [Butyrivibrio sp. YAB3001]|uniref:ABC transporter permease n=1 Tax=Butyrivibrio sp. YAB3001 TaxID=1520812 RepID=UPI0008F63DA4|nr:FtsX-like permease family protein [Butyrivibrio sp. YAB3001]SFB85158.1 putative ABC transport system permease protein [Butyrivibrio sp. YAB3001]